MLSLVTLILKLIVGSLLVLRLTRQSILYRALLIGWADMPLSAVGDKAQRREVPGGNNERPDYRQ